MESKGSKEGSQPGGEEGEAREQGPLKLTLLKSDVLLRWHGETTPNDKGLIMRERITVPVGGGDVTAMLRVAVTGLPGVHLRASLVAQLPPREETRPKLADGGTPEPQVPGSQIDPKDYGGRRNWLARCRTLAEELGSEVVVFPHLVLCEGSTYILYVSVDTYRGPGALEDGQWLMEIYGSGEVEAGEDTMDQDLEEIVRRSWEDPNQDTAQPTRQQRATESRRRWLASKGLLEGGGGAEEATTAAETAERRPSELQQDELAAEELAAQSRAAAKLHSNKAVRDFVELHTKVSPVLDSADPYFIAQDFLSPEEVQATASEQGPRGGGSLQPPFGRQQGSAVSSPVDPEDLPTESAVLALGSKGLQDARRAEVETAAARWQAAQAKMESSRGENDAALLRLAEWQSGFEAECEAKHGQLIAARSSLRDSFQGRLEKQTALRDAIRNEELDDQEQMAALLAAARETGVDVWDPELVARGELKASCLREFVVLASALGGDTEAPERAADEAFAAKVRGAKDLLKQAVAKRVPLSPDLRAQELLDQASDLLAAFGTLRAAVDDMQEADSKALREALLGVESKKVWDASLCDRAELKARALEAAAAFSAAEDTTEATALQEAARELQDVIPQVRGVVPMPESLNLEDLLVKAEERLAQ